LPRTVRYQHAPPGGLGEQPRSPLLPFHRINQKSDRWPAGAARAGFVRALELARRRANLGGIESSLSYGTRSQRWRILYSETR